MDFRMEATEVVGPDRRQTDPTSRTDRAGELAKATQEFEAYILKMLLDQMRKSVPKGGLFGEDPTVDGYRALLDDALARRAAEAGTFGLAEQMLRQLESVK